MPRVREIQFIDEDGNVRGSVTNLEAIKLLTQYSGLLRLSRNKRAFENYAKKNKEGVLPFHIPKQLIDDETMVDLVDFLNGESIYKYNNAQEVLFKNKVLNYENIGSEKDFAGKIYTALQYFMLPESKIKKVFERRLVFQKEGEYENAIEEAMNEMRTYKRLKQSIDEIRTEGNIQNNQKLYGLNQNQYNRYHQYQANLMNNPRYNFPPDARNLSNVDYEAWLRSGGINTLRNYQQQTQQNNWGNNRDNRDNYEEQLMNQFNQGDIGIQELNRLWRARGGKTRKQKQRRRATRRRVR